MPYHKIKSCGSSAQNIKTPIISETILQNEPLENLSKLSVSYSIDYQHSFIQNFQALILKHLPS